MYIYIFFKIYLNCGSLTLRCHLCFAEAEIQVREERKTVQSRPGQKLILLVFNINRRCPPPWLLMTFWGNASGRSSFSIKVEHRFKVSISPLDFPKGQLHLILPFTTKFVTTDWKKTNNQICYAWVHTAIKL